MYKGLHGFFETKVSTGSHPDEGADADEQGPLSEEARTFLLFVAQHPNRMSSEVARDLKISMAGKRIREHLETQGLITVTQGRSTTGRPAMFLDVTEQGLKILGLELPVENVVENLSPVVAPVTKKPDPNCGHHWIIERASGPTSKGICRFCKGERDFKNYVEVPNNPMSPFGI